MSPEKSNLLIAAEWLWSHRRKEQWWTQEVLTAHNDDRTSPKLTLVEAKSVFSVLEKRDLIFPAVRDGRPIYHLHETKEKEWAAFLSELRSGEPKEEGKAILPTEEKTPDITEPRRFAWHHISKNYHHLRAARIAVGAIAVIAFLAGWLLAWNIIVASRDATIEKWRSAAEIADKENEKLSKQNQELKSANTDNAMPLKKRTLILATQLTEFVKRWSTNADNMECYNEYESRFAYRIEKAIQDFDEAGQHSENLNKAYSSGRHILPLRLDRVETVAQELQKLARQLSDDK